MGSDRALTSAQDLLEVLPVPAFAADAEGHAALANARLRALVGDGEPSTWLEVLHPEDAGRIRALWAAAVGAGVPFSADVRVRAAGDGYQPYTLAAAPVCDETGCVAAWSGTLVLAPSQPGTYGLAPEAVSSSAGPAIDEETLRDREAKLRLALDAGDLGVWTLDTARRKFIFDERCQHVFGLPAEVPAKDVLRRVHSDDRAAVEMALKASLKGERDYEVHHRFLLPDGGVRWLHVVGRVQSGAEQRATSHRRDRSYRRRIVGVVRDVTEQMEAESARRATAKLLQTVIDQMPAGITVAEVPSGKFVLYNEEASELLGHARLTADTYAEYARYGALHADGRSYASDEYPLARAIRGETVRQQEMLYRRGDGRLTTLLVNAAPVRDEAGQVALAVCTFYDITDRKRAADELRDSEARFRQLADAMPQLVWTADPDGTVDYYNTRREEYSGLDWRGEAWEWAPVLHADDLDATVKAWQHALETGTRYEAEHRVRMADGSFRWHLSRGTPVRGEAGRVVKWYGTATDIHDLKVSQEALRESEQRFRNMADNLPQLAWMADAGGSLYWYNRRWYDYTGTTLEQVQGWGWQQVHHPDHVERVVERITTAFETGQPWEDTFPMRGRDGTYRWFLSRAMPIRDDEGRVIRWFGTNTDVTEQLQLEEALRRMTETLEEKVAERTADLERANRDLRIARDHFQKAFHASPVASCVHRQEDGQIIDINEEFAHFFGYARAEMLGRTTAELDFLVDPAEGAHLAEAMKGGIRDVETSVRTRAGEIRTILLAMEPIELGGVPCALTMFTDITQRKQAEEAVRQLSSALTLAEQRERRRLASILHDDLQQVLFGAELQLAILRHGIGDDRPTLIDQTETVRMLLKQGIELTRTIALDLSPPILRASGLTEALTWLADHVEEVHGLSVGVEAESDLDLAGEEQRILAVQLVRELLFNVVKHAGVDRARVLARRDADRVVITVEDDGQGFDVNEFLNNRARRNSLGLFSVEERLLLVGGTLAIDSVLGKGTRIEIALPA
jgi:PAS domain S-box-containing protein